MWPSRSAVTRTALAAGPAVVVVALFVLLRPRPQVARPNVRPAAAAPLPVEPSAALATVNPAHAYADAKSDAMPIRWEHAYQTILTSPDEAALRRGEVEYAERTGGDGAVAQTVGLIRATPEACYRVARDYERYTETMPFTDESRVFRTFRLTGPNDAGSEAVDVWSRINLGGATTGYVLRIAHLEEPPARRYRTYWTLVNDPAAAGYADAAGKPCRNDLEVDLGSHLFEPDPADPALTRHTYTLRLVGRGWRRRLLALGGGSSMRQVTRRIRTAAEDAPANSTPSATPR